MSEKQRKIVDSIPAWPEDGELERFYRHIGKAIPPWVRRDKPTKLIYEHRQARAFIAAVEDRPELLQVPEVAEAVDLFRRACEAVELTYETPRNSPKHRAQIEAMFTQGKNLVTPLMEQGLRLNLDRYFY